MSDYKHLKKAELVTVLKKLDIHTITKDTKKVLVEKLDAYVAEHPEDGELTIQTIVEESNETDDEETLNEGEDDEDDEEGDDQAADGAKDDDDEEDKDYQAPPPLDLKEWVVDPIVRKSEDLIQKVYEFTDNVGITYLEYSDELREQLSRSVTLNYAQLLFEVGVFLYTYVPIVALKDNALTHQLLKDNVSFFANSTLPTPQVTALLHEAVAAVFTTWFLTAIILPLAASYYVNFSRRAVAVVFESSEAFVDRSYKYDPFIFALTKVIIFYYLNNPGFVTLSSAEGIFSALKNYILIHVGVYGKFSQTLGNFPIVIGLANVAVALYSQFEDL